MTSDIGYDTISVMYEINAVELRQSLSKLARRLEKDGEPVLLKLGRKPVGVIVSLRDFRERFALKVAEEERRRLVEDILADRTRTTGPVDAALAELRKG